jgi:hypothetical protein
MYPIEITRSNRDWSIWAADDKSALRAGVDRAMPNGNGFENPKNCYCFLDGRPSRYLSKSTGVK